MNDSFERRVHTAAVAGWWTLLTGFILILVQWLAYLATVPAEPAWLLSMWGPNLTWHEVQRLWLWAILTTKLGMLALTLIVLWLTLWSHQLRERS